MRKEQKTALNMAKFIQNQSLLLLEKLNELDLDVEADLCEKLHDDAEHLFRTLSSRLDELMKVCQQHVLNLVKKYKDTIMCGRTHVIHALPIH